MTAQGEGAVLESAKVHLQLDKAKIVLPPHANLKVVGLASGVCTGSRPSGSRPYCAKPKLS